MNSPYFFPKTILMGLGIMLLASTLEELGLVVGAGRLPFAVGAAFFFVRLALADHVDRYHGGKK